MICPDCGGKKTYDNLLADLRSLGMGVLGQHLVARTIKSCSGVAPAVANALRELGYSVSDYGGASGYPGHIDLAVKTEDGWIGVDPTFMQFHCKYDYGEDREGRSPDDSEFDPLMEHFHAITQDPIVAFEILPVSDRSPPDKYSPIPEYYRAKNWVEYFSKMERYAIDVIEDAEKGQSDGWDIYAKLLVAYRKRTGGGRRRIRRRNPRYRRNGDLYRHYVTAGGYMGDQPIDNLIQAVQSSFIDWDLQNPKFIKLFKQSFPHGDSWIEEMGGIQNILLDLLNEDISRQSKTLLKILIRKTKETSGTAESGMLNVELDKWMDLSVRAQRVVVEQLGIDTVEKLINTPKHELVKSRNIGRVTCKELSRHLTKLLEQWDYASSAILEGRITAATVASVSSPAQKWTHAVQVVKGKATQEEINKIQEWIDSGVVKYRRNTDAWES